MEKQKHIWPMLLLIATCLISTNAFAYDAEINGIYYNFNGDKAIVTYSSTSYNSYTGDVVIPKSVVYNAKTYSVTSIGYAAFAYCSSLTSVNIPNSVTNIGESAFYECSSLTSVTIPNSVTSIGIGAFYECSSLTSVTIPNSVKSIGESAFEDCSGLTSVTIPNSVTSIGKAAFEDCSGLTSVTIGNSVTSIGSSAFYNCSGLKKVIVPDIAAWFGIAFGNASANPLYYAKHLYSDETTEITNLIIPNSVTSIGDYAFDGCFGLTSVTIPNSVTSIGKAAFRDCSRLTSVTLNSNAIASKKYISSSSLRNVFGQQVNTYILGGDVTSIGEHAFHNCSALTSVTIGNSVTSIGQEAFYGCSGLASVTIGLGVLSIGINAFTSSPKKVIWLTNTPPNGYANLQGSINYVANNLYTSLKNVTVYPYLSSLFEVEGVKYVPVSPSERTCDAIDCAYNKSVEHIYIGKTVTNRGITLTVRKINPYICYGNTFIKDTKLHFNGIIAQQAFYGCSAMQTAELGQEITSIGMGAFGACKNLKGIEIPDAVESLGSYCFENCSSMTFVKMGNGVNTIPKYSFSGCSSLPTIQIPQNVTNIGDYVFSGCSSLETVLMDDGETELTLGSNGSNPLFSSCPLDSVYIGRNINYSIASDKGYSPFYRNTKLRSVVITDKESEVTVNEFSGCTALQTIQLGSKISSIGERAFHTCSKLEGIVIPDAVDTLGNNTFENCSSMTFVKMSNRVKTIPEYSFSGCSSLPTIQIPQNVTSIGDYVFYRCKSLETVLMDDGETELTLGSNGSSPLFASCPLDSVYIGRNINYSIASDKGYSPFYRNTKLRSVTITDKETEISPNEFYGCTALKNVRIGDGVTTFGNWAFSGCSSLDFFAFGSSVETIGKEAFSDCSALTKLISRAAIPPVCGTQALDDINKWECTLLVPDGSLTLYQTADQWKEFFFTEIDPDGIKGVEAEPSPTSEAECFDLQGRRIDKAQKGINIIRNADGTTKKVLIKR